ncbi:Auxin response factor 4 [Hordeum vulgare]|nr:Auxin response factor 4 [Hordeum vulgare]
MSHAPSVGDPLYDELWHACAGPLVTAPRVRDLVFYFPQGHIEQVKASMNQAAGNQMRLYDLPPKLLCRVINIELKAEADINKVYAQVILMLELEVSSSVNFTEFIDVFLECFYADLNIQSPPSIYPPKRYCDVTGFEGLGPCSTSIKTAEKEIKELAKRINDLCGEVQKDRALELLNDKIFEKVINPYLTEVLQHPQSIEMREGMLHIHDVEGPKKTGSMETRLEAMEQQVFKCQGMVECGLNANHMMITEFTNKHRIDANDIGKHLSRLYGRIDQLQAQIYDLQNQNYDVFKVYDRRVLRFVSSLAD